jgi:hypothetical protein
MDVRCALGLEALARVRFSAFPFPPHAVKMLEIHRQKKR